MPSGKITVIVGPSGCGKTTTLRMVNRMLEPTSGRITWDGNAAEVQAEDRPAPPDGLRHPERRPVPAPHRAGEHRHRARPAGLVQGQDPRSARCELLGSVGWTASWPIAIPVQLSGGQQQRVGVARALAADPLVLLMDEPFSAVDPVVRSELHEFFLGLQRQISKTIILITHDIDEAIKLGDQVAILRVGGRSGPGGYAAAGAGRARRRLRRGVRRAGPRIPLAVVPAGQRTRRWSG